MVSTLPELQNSYVSLDFSQLPLCGRDDQLDALQLAYQDVTDNGSLRVVEVKGVSGTGKTALVEALRDQVDKKKGSFVSGKYHEQQEMPYAALAYALSNMCDLIIESDRATAVAQELATVLHQDKEILCNVIPNLDRLIGKPEGDSMDEKMYRKDWGFERLKIMFRDFLRVVVSEEHPLVIFLDDVQWADEACIRLLSFLCIDKSTKGLLLVAAYREDEVDEYHLLTKFLRKVREETGKVSTIELDNLDVDGVNQIISRLTKLRPELAKPLAMVVHEKSAGNPFYATEFLQSLEQQHLLQYSLSRFAWEFDVEKVKTETNIAENVADLVAHKIGRLPAELQEILQVAACFGSHFNVETIGKLIRIARDEVQIEDYKAQAGYNKRLEGRLDEACHLRLLDKCVASGKYKFAHDRIQSGAYEMVPIEGGVRCQLHLKIGNFLREKIRLDNPEEALMFVAANQFAQCPTLINDALMKHEVARLDLNVAEMAIKKSAFVPAAEYLRSGIGQLSEKDWDTDYELVLRMHTLLAHVAYSIGDFESCKKTVGQIMTFGWSLGDKMPAYFTLTECLCSEGMLKEALEVGSEILGKLWEPIPLRPGKRHVAVDLVKTKRLLKGKSEEDLLSYKATDDVSVIFAMKLMTGLVSAAWLAVEPELLALMCLRMVRLTLLRGVSKYSAAGFGAYGFLMATLGNHGEGYRYGKIAERLTERFVAPETESRVVVMIHIFLNHLRKPYHESLEPLLGGYRSGMIYGDIESATMCILAYSSMFLFCGLALVPLEEDMRRFGNQIKTYGQAAVLNVYNLYWQCVLNFLDQSTDPARLTGEVMDQDDMMTAATETNQIVTVQGIWWIQMMLCYYFGDLDAAAKLAQLLSGRRKSVDKTTHSIYQKHFYIGLTMLALAKKRRNPIYLIRANKTIRKFGAWVKEGNVNCHHMLLILTAEKVSLGYKKIDASAIETVGPLYEKAISSASRSGFLHHSALGNELYAMFLLHQQEQGLYELRIFQSYETYAEWGSIAKVQHMLQAHEYLRAATTATCDSKSASSGSGNGSYRAHARSHKGRSRFTSVSSTDLHQGKSIKSSIIVQDVR